MPPEPCTVAEPISAPALLELVGELYEELHHAKPAPGVIALSSTLDGDLGLDSLARVELLLRLEQRFQIHLPESALGTVETVADLWRAAGAATPVLPGDGRIAGSATTAALKLPGARRLPGAADALPLEAATLPEVLAWRVRHDPAATHLTLLADQGALPLSYDALSRQAALVARGLQRHNIGTGAAVALMLPTSPDFFVAFFGVLMAGAIPVPIYPPAHASQLEEHVRRHALILANAGAEALITVSETAAVARLLRIRVPSLRHIWPVAELSRGEAGAEAGESSLPAITAESIALLQYTSGSTGAPKGVMLTHRHLLANIRAMGRQIHADASDVFVSWLPLYHDMGLIGAWLGSLYFGCLFVVMPPTAFLVRPSRWLRAIHEYRATISAAPNFGYELAARRIPEPDLAGVNLSSWRIAFNGAEPVLPETIERFQRRFAAYGFRAQAVTPVYGLAEAAVGLTFPPPGRGPLVDCVDRMQLMRTGRAVPATAGSPGAIRFVSSGLPLRGYQLRIVDVSGAEQPERVEGALQFSGPSATEGYYRNPEATARLRIGKWRDTGDRAYLANGEIFITGRSKDIIIRRGRHIYPDELERVIGELSGVRKGCVAAFGSAEPATATEKLVVVAETHVLDVSQRATLVTAINARVIGCIGEPPEEILLAAPHTVLKTSSGKLRRAATRAAYDEGALFGPRPSSAQQLLRLGLESTGILLRRTLQRGARIVYGLYAWAIASLLFVPLICLSALSSDSERTWRLTRRTAAAIVRGWRVALSVHAEPGFDWSVPHVVVVNHCSYTDSLFVAAVLPTAHCFVAKLELLNWPVLRGLFRRLGTIFVERADPGQSLAELQQLKQALAGGRSIVVFPEGTFTRATGLRAFHLGAFEAAVAAGVPVVPVALKGTRSMLRDEQILPRRVPVEIVIGTPVRESAGSDAFAAAVRLRDATRSQILQHCGEPDLP